MTYVRRCIQYSWVGVVTDETNQTQSCASRLAMGIPCYEPLVWTEGENRFNGPDPEELLEACQNGEAQDGKERQIMSRAAVSDSTNVSSIV
jgi:hypothetical protein